MKWLGVLTVLMLSACGVDGEPVQPTGGVNVSLTPSGVGLGANVGLRKGPLSLGVGL
jgi:uncharacterized lipoprotein